MHIRIPLAISFLLMPVVAAAQSSSVRVQPYAFVAPGGSSEDVPALHAGGGVDVVHPSGLGGGAEFFYAGRIPDGFDYGLGLMSFGASYRFGEGRLQPMVGAGYTQTVLRGTGDLFYLGAGAEYWVRPGVGLRFELRDHTRDRNTHLWGARVGLTWGLGS